MCKPVQPKGDIIMCQFTNGCDGVMFQGACSDCGAHPQADDMLAGKPREERRIRGDGLTRRQYREEMDKIQQKAGL